MQILGKAISIERVIYEGDGVASRWGFITFAMLCVSLLGLNIQSDINLNIFSHQWASLYDHNTHYLAEIEGNLLKDFGQLNALMTQLKSSLNTSVNNALWSKDVSVIYHEFVAILSSGSHYVLSAIAVVGGLQIVNYLSDWLAPIIFNVLLGYMSVWGVLMSLKPRLIHQATLQWVSKLLGVTWLCMYVVIPYSIHISSAVTHEIETHFHNTISHDYFASIGQDISQTAHKMQSKSNEFDKQGAAKSMEPAFTSKIAQAQLQRGAKVIMTALAHSVISLLLAPLSIGFVLYLVFCHVLRGLTRQEVRSTPVCGDPVPITPLK